MLTFLVSPMRRTWNEVRAWVGGRLEKWAEERGDKKLRTRDRLDNGLHNETVIMISGVLTNENIPGT